MRTEKVQKKIPRVGTLSRDIFEALRVNDRLTSREIMQAVDAQTVAKVSSVLVHFEARGLVHVVDATLTLCGPILVYRLTDHARSL